MTDKTHGERRLGLLTGSRAKIIMNPSTRAWESLRDQMWKEGAEQFDKQIKTGPRAWGHEKEEPGADKFWLKHPTYEMEPGGFYLYQSDDELSGWLGNSPDRQLINIVDGKILGLEVKSPTTAETFEKHTLAKHYDQMQHGALVTGWSAWWLAVHFSGDNGRDLYKEFHILPDLDWQKRYRENAKKFLKFCYAGHDIKHGKKRAAQLL